MDSHRSHGIPVRMGVSMLLRMGTEINVMGMGAAFSRLHIARSHNVISNYQFLFM